MEDKKVLIFGLYDCLVHYAQADEEADLKAYGTRVKLRPGLVDFLTWAFSHWKVGIWSDSNFNDTSDVVDGIWRLLPVGTPRPFTILAYDHQRKTNRKTLGFGGYTDDEFLLIDSNAKHVTDNIPNAIRMPRYFPKHDDLELALLRKYLSGGYPIVPEWRPLVAPVSPDPRPLVILDLDDTLIYMVRVNPPKYFDVETSVAGVVMFVTFRPFLFEFLAAIAPRYQVAIWTAGSPEYAAVMTREIFSRTGGLTPVFVFSREETTFGVGSHYKDLNVVADIGFDLRKTLLIDDSDETKKANPNNVIKIAPFFGSGVYPDPRYRPKALQLGEIAIWLLENVPDFRVLDLNFLGGL